MGRRTGPVEAIAARIAIHFESPPTALQLAAILDRCSTDPPNVPHAGRHEGSVRLLAYAHEVTDLAAIERWSEEEPHGRGTDMVARIVEDAPLHAPKRRFGFNAALTALDHGDLDPR